MRTLLLAMLVACGPAAQVRVPADPLVVTRHDLNCVTRTAPDEADSHAVERTQVAAELDRVDRELDAIDDELAASAIAAPATRDEAVVAMSTQLANLKSTTLEAQFAGTPGMLVRLAMAYSAARAAEEPIEAEVGPKNPAFRQAHELVELAREAFQRQLEVEIDESTTLLADLTKLPKNASQAAIKAAMLGALLVTIVRHEEAATVPTDAPANVRIVADTVAELTHQLQASPELGPKHPTIVALRARLEAAHHAMHDATIAAAADLGHQIVALQRTQKVQALDPAKLSRRAELAARARDLRHELDALR
jgi:hypothetical protein